MATNARPLQDRRGRVYTPAVGKGLRPWLWLNLGGFALLGATGVYLASVSLVTWLTSVTQQTYFYMMMVALHILLGTLIIVPFIVFGLGHLVTSWKRPNRSAVNYGLVLLVASIVILVSGVLLVRAFGIEIRDPRLRRINYWLHVAIPVLAIALYVKHRLAGPLIRWKWARRIGTAMAVFVVAMGTLHSAQPKNFGQKGSVEGEKYFQPSEATTSDGKFIPASVLMADNYCLKCHEDSYKGWFHSSHHFSSFNNKAYLFSVRETRKVGMERDGSTRAARWCAGCHDPVPFFSGKFDDPNYDDVSDPTSQAGITCTVCHSITNVNSTRGNADYTIEEPQHYPFAFSDNPALQWVNQTLIKAKPEMHKRTFLKPIIKDAKFCSTCHKVGLPYALNHYQDFVRGQNHYDTYHLSGVSGKGARSFYYPPEAKTNCNECHMNLIASNEFGAKDFDGKGGLKVHNHMFPAANTGLSTIRGSQETADAHAKYLSDAKVRVDLFGIREGAGVEGKLIAPLRPEAPTLKPGNPYLVEVVVRTLGVGHPLTQGTVDSNEIWVELVAKSGDRIVGRSGGIGEDGAVDPYAHFINVYMLDREGRRIDRRNPQDIFVPLYNKQIPPGAGQVVHFALDVPKDLKAPITLEARLNYRKFDRKYLDYIFGKGQGPELPVVVMAKDAVNVAVEGGAAVKNDPSPIKPELAWQRWNDYGIGLFLEGTDKGGSKGELKQAEEVFKKVAELGQADGYVNLARVYQREGRIPEALAALEKAAKHPKPGAPWVISWLSAQIDARNGFLDEAISKFESVLNTKIPERKFDFSEDYEVLNELGRTLYARALQEKKGTPARGEYLKRTAAAYRRTLAVDSENVAAHYGLGLVYSSLAAEAGGVKVAKAAEGTKVSVAGLREQIKALNAGERDPAKRAAMAERLGSDLAAFLAAPRDPMVNRLDPMHEAVEALSKVYASETDAAASSAQVAALAAIHKDLQRLLKPDETAEGRAVAIARKNDPAADQNAQSIVIRSLHRPGAPGLTPKKQTASTPTKPETQSDTTASREPAE